MRGIWVRNTGMLHWITYTHYCPASLEQVYGAITFYLADRAEIDAYLTETERLWEEARKNQSPIPPALRERLERARRQLTSHA